MMIMSKKQKLLFYSGGALLALALSACTGTEIASSSSEATVASSQANIPASSSSAPATSIGSVSNGQSLMGGSGCVGCHTDNGDGTFGGLVPFNAKTMNRGNTAAELAAYISRSMPSTSPSLCTGTCANDTAAYLWSFKNGGTPVTSTPTSTTSSAAPSVGLAKPGAGYVALPNERGTYNYEGVLVDESTGFDKSVSLESFKTTLYPHLRSSTCAQCHTTDISTANGGSQAPLHADSNVELAHEYALTRVNFKDPRESKFVVRMELDRHNCGGRCSSAADDMEDAILAWKAGVQHMLPETTRGIAAGTNISTSQVEQWIATDKNTLSNGDKEYIVYTSLHEVHNAGISADDLNIVRVGLSKALNSVARWAPEIVNPEDVTGDGILYKFDIRDYWAWSQLPDGQVLYFGGSDDDLAFGADGKFDYRGDPIQGGQVGQGTQGNKYKFTNNTWNNPKHALQVWERILHGNVEGASQNSNLDPNLKGFKGPRKTTSSGDEYVDINGFEWVEASQLVYTLTRPDVYNAIMAIPFFMDELEKNLEIDNSQGADSYDWVVTFDAITVDSRLLFRAKRPGADWYWKSFDIFSGQLAGGERSIFDVYEEGGTDIRFPWWANPEPKFVKWLQVQDDNSAFSFVASLNQTFGNSGGFGFAGHNAPGCDKQAGFVPGLDFGNCRHYTGEGGAMQSAEEMIFNIPNGLQGYALAGGFNQRRVDAFTNIVRDPRILTKAGDNIASATGYSYSNPEGSFRQADPRLNNGSSCIGCHVDGMNRMGNDMRNWLDNAPDRLPKGPYGVDDWVNNAQKVARVRELYPEENALRETIESDRLTFLTAMGKIKSEMIWGDDKNVYVEPIIWTVEYAQRTKYNYPQTTSN